MDDAQRRAKLQELYDLAQGSEEFYGGLLVPDESVRVHRLCDLPGVQDDPLTREPVLFLDTGFHFPER